MENTGKKDYSAGSRHYPELFVFAESLLETAAAMQRSFNQREVKLIELKAHQRIFVFFLTRAIKTYTAIYNLCRDGYGQDAATLLRGFLENIISVEYMLCSAQDRDKKAVRFVDYKWIIFKRYLAASPAESQAESAQRALIYEHYEEFKAKYAITSDRALLTWSGKSARDMAKLAQGRWLQEYDEVFRKYSRFSHPSIIGDTEYLDFKTNELTLSAQPSLSGILVAIKHATDYLVSFLERFDELFALGFTPQLADVRQKRARILASKAYSVDYSKEKNLPPLNKESARLIRVSFHLP